MTNSQGFTVVEVLVAIMVLGVGILALVGSSTLVTRMVGEGKRATFATQIAQQRIEWVRRRAMNTSPQCTLVPAATLQTPCCLVVDPTIRCCRRWFGFGHSSGAHRRFRDVALMPIVRG